MRKKQTTCALFLHAQSTASTCAAFWGYTNSTSRSWYYVEVGHFRELILRRVQKYHFIEKTMHIFKIHVLMKHTDFIS
jgi:hypothetical protein